MALLPLLTSWLVIVGASGSGDAPKACSTHGAMHHVDHNRTKSPSLVQVHQRTKKETVHTESMSEEVEDNNGAALILHARPSPVGSDSSGCGSKARPCATVKRAVEENIQQIEKATQPTMLYVSGTFPPPSIMDTAPHGGDTRVTVAPPDRAPLIITPPPGSSARFEGRARISDLMQGDWKTWKRGSDGGNIYVATLKRPVWQLWLGDESLTVARYPDVEKDWFRPWPKTFPLSLTSARGARGAGYKWMGQHLPKKSSYDDYAYGTHADGYWGGWFTTDGGDAGKHLAGNNKKNAKWDKKSSTGSLSDSKLRDFDFTGGIIHSRMCYKTEFWHPLPITKHRGNTIDFRADLGGKLWKGPDACTKGYKMPEKFYIEALDALNRPNEWWFDRATQKLYLYLPGGADPKTVSSQLMGKVNDKALDFTSSKNVHLQGLEFFGTFAVAGEGGGGAMKDNNFMFPNYPRHILWENQLVQNSLAVTNQRFINNNIRFFCYGSVYRGPLVHVENNLMEYGIYGCGPMGCGAMFVPNGDKPIVTRNTIRYTQQWHGIVWLGSDFEASYNHLHDLATIRDDASMFQTKFAGELRSHIHHNWAYNSELKGVRYDTCGGKGDKGYPGCAGAVWNNVFFNAHQGANIKGDHQLVVGNTGFANGKRVDITVSPRGVGGTEDGFIYNKYSTTHNNAVDILSAHDSRCGLPLPGKSSINYASKCKQNSEQANTAMESLLRDPFNLDFRPRNIQYPKGLLNGAAKSVPKFTAGGGRKVDLVGGKDLGAYQYNANSYFIPGKMFQSASTPIPPHTTTSARVDLDLMFLGGLGATHHDVYVSTDPCRALLADKGSSENIKRVHAPSNIVAPGRLDPAVWYYWRVDAVSKDGGVVRGPVWCFAVGAGAGGCSQPPCSNPQGIKGQLCATDNGSEQPHVPEGCKANPTTMTPPISSTTSGVLDCKDTNPGKCAKWKRRGRCSRANVQKACPKSCGACNTNPTTTTPRNPTTTTPPISSTTSAVLDCKDTNPGKCAKWKRRGRCSRANVKKACPKSCGACNANPTTSTPPGVSTTGALQCEDTTGVKKCAKWKRKGRCFKANVKKACRKTCGLCTT